MSLRPNFNKKIRHATFNIVSMFSRTPGLGGIRYTQNAFHNYMHISQTTLLIFELRSWMNKYLRVYSISAI
jgi:hypothetical protein